MLLMLARIRQSSRSFASAPGLALLRELAGRLLARPDGLARERAEVAEPAASAEEHEREDDERAR